MSDEIVRRLLSKRRGESIKESLSDRLNEVEEDYDEDEEDLMIGNDDDEVEDDLPSHRKSSHRPQEEEPTEDEGDNKEEDDSNHLELEKDGKPGNVNPLDNQYAVNFQLGDLVTLTYSNGTPTDVEAVIDGYDKEGFYRIKVGDGMTISGLTDIALSSLVKQTNESKCICGHKKFVMEGTQVVCDKCGRSIRESSIPMPQLHDKKKDRIRAEHHAMSTSARSGVSDSIKKAFGRRLKEEVDLGEFSDLEQLKGEFWTRLNELVEDIEELGYEVLDYNSEYVVIASKDEDSDDELVIYLDGTSRTIVLDFDRVKIL